jgi:hypothetical protein
MPFFAPWRLGAMSFLEVRLKRLGLSCRGDDREEKIRSSVATDV